MTDFLPIFGMILFGAALGGVATFAALYLVGKNGGIIVELTPDEERIVAEERLRELGVGTGGNVEAQLWPARVVRQQRIVAAMRRRAS